MPIETKLAPPRARMQLIDCMLHAYNAFVTTAIDFVLQLHDKESLAVGVCLHAS